MLAARPVVAVLACLLLAACTGGNDQAAGRTHPPEGRSG